MVLCDHRIPATLGTTDLAFGQYTIMQGCGVARTSPNGSRSKEIIKESAGLRSDTSPNSTGKEQKRVDLPLVRFSSSSLAWLPSNRKSSKSFLLARRLTFAFVSSGGIVAGGEGESEYERKHDRKFLFRTGGVQGATAWWWEKLKLKTALRRDISI